MSPTLDVRRAFRKSRFAKSTEEPQVQHFTDNTDITDLKARHVLGLDDIYAGPGRNNSTSTTSTTKLPSVTFSDATTAAVSADSGAHNVKDEPSHADLDQKGSSVLSKQHQTPGLDDRQIKPQISNTSLRSFYDKNGLPLSVSQQTSDSSTRDFALRLGVPSIISASSQEMEHTKQMRFFTKAQKAKHDRNKLSPVDMRPVTMASQRSLASIETRSDAGDSFTSQSSLSHTSTPRGILKGTSKSSVASKQRNEAFEMLTTSSATMDSARAKVNVRRPKVGAKNWFDSLDSDSDDGSAEGEPQAHRDFAVEVEAAFDNYRVDKLSSRSSSKTPTVTQSFAGSKSTHTTTAPEAQKMHEPILKPPVSSKSRKRKVNRLAGIDLTKQSVLLSSSSDDSEEEILSASTSYQELARREIRESLMNGSWDESAIELGQATAVDTQGPERLLQLSSKNTSKITGAPRRVSSRLLTYLDDGSSEKFTQNHDLLTSFPRTPSDTPSRATSVQESVLSEDASILSTKFMNVTRQEQDLIAAMRRKKVAMKRAQATAHRQGTLKILELDSSRNPKSHRQGEQHRDRLHSPLTPRSPLRLSYLVSPSTAQHSLQRPDSVTTFQTDSVQQPSVRSSMATYLSEGSGDLQLPYSSTDGLPMGSMTLPQRTKPRPNMPARDTFLSERTTTTTDTASCSEWSPSTRTSARDSHVVVLDPLERQLLRDEIPSQLFMERPFLGWEARANTQTAH